MPEILEHNDVIKLMKDMLTLLSVAKILNYNLY